MNVLDYLTQLDIIPDQSDPLPDGLTNQVSLINTVKFGRVVIKQYPTLQNNFTDERRELYQNLAKLRTVPKIHSFLDDGHVEEFVDGSTLTPFQATQQHHILAKLIGTLHRRTTPLATGKIQCWDWITNQLASLSPKGINMVEGYLGQIKDIPNQINRIRRQLDTTQTPLAVCHNDLNLTNILRDSSGELHLIDWEWVGINPCLFDLAGLWHHLHLGENKTTHFCQVYQNNHVNIPNMATKLKMWLAPNRLWWGLWAVNQLHRDLSPDRLASIRTVIHTCFSTYQSLLMDWFPPTVYVVGVFDLLHLGHMNLLAKAKAYAGGGKLIVGVHNDQLVEGYKRTPLTTHDTRVKMVAQLACVDQVISDAPSCRECDIEWYKKYGIDYHISGDNSDFYHLQRKLGIFVVLDSEYSIHTTDIIRKLQ